jgi:hypothetical protein
MLSTLISPALKKALDDFCAAKGLKIQNVVENGILEQIEDAIDLEEYEKRKNEERIPLKKLFKDLKL